MQNADETESIRERRKTQFFDSYIDNKLYNYGVAEEFNYGFEDKKPKRSQEVVIFYLYFFKHIIVLLSRTTQKN